MMAFVVHRDEEGGPGSYLRRSSTLSQLLATILYLFQTLVGDSFLLFRMAIVWGRDWRIVSIPLVLLIASIGIGISSEDFLPSPDPNFSFSWWRYVQLH